MPRDDRKWLALLIGIATIALLGMLAYDYLFETLLAELERTEAAGRSLAGTIAAEAYRQGLADGRAERGADRAG